jgi:cobalt transporter subunit CbtB
MPLGNREGAWTHKPQVRRPAESVNEELSNTEGDPLMTTNRLSIAKTIPQRIGAGLSLIFFGAFLVMGVGVAHSDKLHNAAHDTRHALGFPCH